MQLLGPSRGASGLQAWGRAFLFSTLTTNVLVTLLIAGRLYWIEHALRREGVTRKRKPPYQLLMLAMIESGAIISIMVTLQIILYSLHNTASYIMFIPLGQIVVCVASRHFHS
jgi:hypothetical protein